jgi:hypothetical protein
MNPHEWQVYARIHWASSALNRLNEAAKGFLENQLVTTVTESNADATEYLIRVDKGIDGIPIEIALMIGDVAHHARSALDWLAYGLAAQPNECTSFPIWSVPHINKGTGKREQPSIPGGITAAVKKLVKAVQPYTTGKGNPADHPLVWMRKLDNIHKHRHLVAAACSDNGYLYNIPVEIHGSVSLKKLRSELKPGEPVARITISEPNPNLQFDYRPLPHIGINGVAPVLENANIGAELDEAIYMVAGITEIFAEHLRR